MRNCGKFGTVFSLDRAPCNVTVIARHRLSLASLVFAAFLLPITQSARAQFSANSQTITISGVTSNWAGNGSYVVGSNTFSDTLQIISSGVLSNGTGVLGFAPGGSNNTAVVSGSGSLWKNSTNLFVGFLGTANQLIVTNGGRVLDPAGTLGYTNGNASTAWVTGPGSVWSNTLFFYVGYSGSGNQLIVTNGGLIWSGAGYVGANSFASNNLAAIIGTGSVWTATNALFVGDFGSSNTLAITAGGKASAPGAYLGVDVSSSNNLISVIGPGSTFSNTFDFFLGLDGSNNQLIVSNGAYAGNNSGFIGFTNSSAGNTALVGGPGSLWTNKTDLYVGYLGSFNQMVVTNGARVFSGVGYEGWFNTASNNTVTITGTGSVWSATNDIYIGIIGSSNQLIIANGGNVSALESRIGFNPVATNSAAFITGSGSTWSNQVGTIVGFGAVASQLTISNGATVFDTVGIIGETNQSSRNTATVTGSGSMWINTNALYVGFLASSNELVLANGGAANALSTYLAFASVSSNNLLVATGNGTILSNTFNTYIGLGGSSNKLYIANGAAVFDEVGILAESNSSIGNIAWIDGPGSVWTNSLFLAIGYNGRLNQLVVTNGGTVFSGDGYLASFNTTSASNTATITGSGSLWATTNGLYTGYIGASNQLFIVNGGATRALSSYLGFLLFASNNVVTVSDPNSIFSNAFNIYLGVSGPANRLIVSNGATAFDEEGVMSFTNSSFGNTALVDGSGSMWTNTLNLFVGYVGAGNQLIVTNGGAVCSPNSYLGAFAFSSNNSVIVTGTGSLWVTTITFDIGDEGSGNSFTIKDGGLAIGGAVLGNFPGSSNNTALVTGAGSVWSNTLDGVAVGGNGCGNSMTISNGGLVLGLGLVGASPSSSNNSLLVTGTGSAWTNTSSTPFYIGEQTRSNRLQITSGGTVFDSIGILGYFGGTNNLAVVAGPGSVWNNTNQFYVGYDGYGSRLVVSNSGAVFGGALDTYLGQLLNYGANSNTVLVSGSGSIWSNPANLFIGEDAYGNSLIISNGGVVFNNAGWLGYGSFANDSSNNLAVVTGAGSVWNNAGTLTIGKGGQSNQLFVTLGGLVNAQTINVGQFVFGNLLRMTNGTLQASSINIAAGNTLSGSGFVGGNVVNLGTVSANISGGTLTFENGLKNQGFVSATNGGILSVFGTFFNLGTTSFNGGTAIFHGPVLSAQGTTNIWNVTASGPWEQGADWSLGVPSTTNAAILITNAVSKTVTVSSNTFATAPGSVTNFGLRVSGPSGSTNMLLVANTGTGNPFVVVNFTIDTNAIAIVTNATLQVGVQSSGTLTINGKVQVTSGGLFDSSNTGTMNVGLAGSAAFSVVGGGTALSAGVIIGSDFLSNTVLVSDSGSVWSNSLFQLNSGSLMITNGGAMISLGGIVGDGDVTGIVIDTGSVWITDGLTVGNDESEFNQLIITNGGAVYVHGSSAVVDQFGGGGNQLIVSGNGALLDASPAILYVGLFSFLPDRVDIGPGGTVLASFANLGQGSGATNLINVSGGALFVTNAFGSTMQIFQGTLALNGGTVTVDDLILTTNLGTVAFSAGTLYSASTQATNGVPFVVGDGADAANFELLGGVHAFNSLRIRNAAMLSGCGTVTGSVLIDAGGTVLSDCGTLTFTGIVTNNGTLRAINGSVLETYSNLVNNGTIDIINGGVTNFHGSFINHGTILDASSVKISQVTASGENFVAQIPSTAGHTYQLQFTPSLTPTNWTNTGPSQPGTGSPLTFTDPSGLTNFPARFYRVDCTAP
jgi:T5SS/PEP-CTERM-associated repeat protein